MSYQIQPTTISAQTSRYRSCECSRARHIELIVFEQDVFVVAPGIAFDLVSLGDRLTGHGIDKTTVDAMTGLAIERVKANLVALRRAGIIATGQVTSESLR